MAARVARNMSNMRARGKYLDFATIFLIVVRGDDAEVLDVDITIYFSCIAIFDIHK